MSMSALFFVNDFVYITARFFPPDKTQVILIEINRSLDLFFYGDKSIVH